MDNQIYLYLYVEEGKLAIVLLLVGKYLAVKKSSSQGFWIQNSLNLRQEPFVFLPLRDQELASINVRGIHSTHLIDQS